MALGSLLVWVAIFSGQPKNSEKTKYNNEVLGAILFPALFRTYYIQFWGCTHPIPVALVVSALYGDGGRIETRAVESGI